MTARLDAARYWPTRTGILAMRAIARLPLRVQFAIGRMIGGLTYLLGRERRHVTEVNLGLCFPELARRERRALTRAVFASLGISTIETTIAWMRDPEDYRARVTVEGVEHLREAQRRGRGVVLAGAHFATLDMAGALLSLVADLDVMYRRNKNPFIEEVMTRGRERNYEGVIERKDIRTALTRLKAGRTIWYAADQDYGPKHSVFAPFFGMPAATIVATGRFARFNDSPVLFFSHFRDPKRCTWSLRISPVLEGFPSGDDLADATRLNAIIEHEIRRHPDQYLWLHRRFKTRPAGEARPY